MPTVHAASQHLAEAAALSVVIKFHLACQLPEKDRDHQRHRLVKSH